jgi:hypothetical protein
MPAFKPCAGFSPSCWAVLVHKEHCATAFIEVMLKRKIKSAMVAVFFTTAKLAIKGIADVFV